MLLTITYTDREIERLMTRIPNFRPRGYGTFVFNKFEYSPEDCDCKYCLRWQKEECTENKCPYMKERITAGAISIKEALLEALSTVNHFTFQIRLRNHIRESEENTMAFKNEKHKQVFTEAIRKMNKKDNVLMAAIYLFTADGLLWKQVSRYVDRGEIAYNRIRPTNTTETGYTLFCCAKDLSLGTKHLTISDLVDSDLIPPKLFGVICNAMAIRRYGLGAIQFK